MKRLVLLVALLAMTGCASIRYNAKTGDMSITTYRKDYEIFVKTETGLIYFSSKKSPIDPEIRQIIDSAIKAYPAAGTIFYQNN